MISKRDLKRVPLELREELYRALVADRITVAQAMRVINRYRDRSGARGTGKGSIYTKTRKPVAKPAGFDSVCTGASFSRVG